MPTAGCVFSVYSSATVGTFFVFFFSIFFCIHCCCCCSVVVFFRLLLLLSTATGHNTNELYGILLLRNRLDDWLQRLQSVLSSSVLLNRFYTFTFSFFWLSCVCVLLVSLSRSLRFFLCHCDTRNIHLAYTHTLHMYKWQNEEWVEKKGTKNTDTTYDILWV